MLKGHRNPRYADSSSFFSYIHFIASFTFCARSNNEYKINNDVVGGHCEALASLFFCYVEYILLVVWNNVEHYCVVFGGGAFWIDPCMLCPRMSSVVVWSRYLCVLSVIWWVVVLMEGVFIVYVDDRHNKKKCGSKNFVRLVLRIFEPVSMILFLWFSTKQDFLKKEEELVNKRHFELIHSGQGM